MSRENFISRHARGLETVVKVVDVPPYFERQNRDEEVTLVIRCTNVELTLFLSIFSSPK